MHRRLGTVVAASASVLLLAAGSGARPEAGRHVAHVSLGQPAQRLDPRGGNRLDDGAVHAASTTTWCSTISIRSSTPWTPSGPELATSWAWDDDQDQADLQAAQRRDGGTTASRSPPRTWSARWTSCRTRAPTAFRKNPRKIWWHNLKEVTANGDHEVTFHLGRPQASFVALFATGYNPVYPCHVSAADMRTKPIGTGPFKFVEFKSNESVKLVRNPDYWRKGHPYIDAIEWRVISNRSTRVLAFVAGEFDMTFSLDLTVALVKDIQSQLPKAICELQPTNNSTNLIVNRDVAPVQRPARSAPH